ncbi:TetR family transcriptional regulator [Cohnella zeiphila]|uniref:TetR/AcrR family transcriptional regulator n=1 Tax=Cohnella zeiphila TaxID=2761120 RepID=A0A7X0VZC3_9BACL|nr:TetR/AcrR family transcriptional regulator [Cohnella zeiphila]
MEPPETNGASDSRDLQYRRRILEAASRLFERSGIESVNMYQIAQEAGIGQGTLYRRFEHPGEIYSELLHASVEEILTELEGIADDDSDRAPASALDRLDEIVCKVLDYIDSHAKLLSAISCMYGKKKFLPHKRPVTDRLHGVIRRCLSRATEQGEIRGIDVGLTAHFMLTTLTPEQYLYHREDLDYSKEQYLAGVRRLFLEGIRER